MNDLAYIDALVRDIRRQLEKIALIPSSDVSFKEALTSTINNYLQQIRDIKSYKIVNITDTWYTSYEIEPTRNKRRRGRRFFTFTNNHNELVRRRVYFRDRDEAIKWADSILGPQNSWLEVRFDITPSIPIDTITVHHR